MDSNITEINKEINNEINKEIKKNKYKYKKVGSREDVYLGYAKNTSGGLRKDDIILKKKGKQTKYVSKRIADRMRDKIITQGALRKRITQKCPITFKKEENKVIEYVYYNPIKSMNSVKKFEDTIQQLDDTLSFD